MDNFKLYVTKFKIAFAILLITLNVFILLILKVIPVFQNIMKIQNEITTQSATLADTERKLTDLQANAKKRAAEDAVVLKEFFKPSETGLDTEAVIADEFDEILLLNKKNKIKTISVKYEYDPQDDNFVKNVGNRYNVCKLNVVMVASYANFENFLKDLYRHEHFLDISTIEITPYAKNKRILLINLQLKLYAQKDPSSIVEPTTPGPSSTEGPSTGEGPDAMKTPPTNSTPYPNATPQAPN